MIIAIDLDEILADTTPALIRYHNDTYATSYAIEDFVSYEWWNVWGGTREESVRKFMDFVKSPYFQEVGPIVGSEKAIQQLKKEHILHIVTSRQLQLQQETKKWVEKYFPKMFHGLHVTNHAQWALSGRTRSKIEVCQELGTELLIEDSLVYAKECEEDEIPVLLLDYPWNRGEIPKNTKRVYSWEEILQNIKDLQNIR